MSWDVKWRTTRACWSLCCLGFLGMLHIQVHIKEGARSESRSERAKRTDTTIKNYAIRHVKQ
jgi:hypothetical protein